MTNLKESKKPIKKEVFTMEDFFKALKKASKKKLKPLRGKEKKKTSE